MATTEQPEEGPARIGVVEVVEGHGGDGSEAKALHCAWATDGYSVSTVYTVWGYRMGCPSAFLVLLTKWC